MASNRILYIFKTVNYEEENTEITIDDNIYKKVKILTTMMERFQNQTELHFEEHKEFMKNVMSHLTTDKD